MHHLAFFESQALRKNDRNPPTENREKFMSGSTNPNNGLKNGDCEVLKEKTITDDMPKWKKEQLKKQNEKIRREIEERNLKKKREEVEHQQKWEGVPAWKATIMRKREEIKKLEEDRLIEAQRKEEEEKERWENLPAWKRDIYQKKGIKPVKPVNKNVKSSQNDSQVTRDNSTPDEEAISQESNEASEMVVNGENSEVDPELMNNSEDTSENDAENNPGNEEKTKDEEMTLEESENKNQEVAGDASQEIGPSNDETCQVSPDITITVEQDDMQNGNMSE